MAFMRSMYALICKARAPFEGLRGTQAFKSRSGAAVEGAGVEGRSIIHSFIQAALLPCLGTKLKRPQAPPCIYLPSYAIAVCW